MQGMLILTNVTQFPNKGTETSAEHQACALKDTVQSTTSLSSSPEQKEESELREQLTDGIESVLQLVKIHDKHQG